MPDAAAWFSGVADEYDAVRPQPPADLITLIIQWAGRARPDVVDLGAGTGLSAAAWAGRARQVTAVEPSEGMRRRAERRFGAAAAESGTRFTVLDATAEATGLPDGCADVVTASQAMHWFDPGRALPEIARLLRPGGVLAAYDCDWPPCVDWQTGAAWALVAGRVDAEQARRGLAPVHRGKDHLGRLAWQRPVPALRTGRGTWLRAGRRGPPGRRGAQRHHPRRGLPRRRVHRG